MHDAKAKVPFRIPLVGGLSDLPAYYRQHGGESICCTIDRYIYVTIEKNGHGGIDIRSAADLPWGIGLGSSGAYYSALILAMAQSKKQTLSKLAVAKLAYDLETGIEDNATGRQDSLACLHHGITKYSYLRDDSVIVNEVPIPNSWQKLLSDRLLLFDTGERRRACDSLKDIVARKNVAVLSAVAKLPSALLQAWEGGDLDFLASALDLQEHYRGELSPSCKGARTDRLLAVARRCGAGARLAGAGLGCLVCYCREEKQPLLKEKLGLPQIPFSILW